VRDHNRPRPRLRGASHRIAFYIAPLAALGLLWLAASHGHRAVIACAVYAVTMVALFGVSSSYHRYRGRPEVKLRWQRADHSMIFVMIAGTYTPFCVLGVRGALGVQMLAMIWAGAGLGVILSTAWTNAPRGLSAALYVALGWLLIWYLPQVHAGVGDELLSLIFLGGAFYTVGALIYAVRFPDPRPAVFGYHEIFHLLVIAAAVCHFAVVVELARAA
jgi:hemolysin III